MLVYAGLFGLCVDIVREALDARTSRSKQAQTDRAVGTCVLEKGTTNHLFIDNLIHACDIVLSGASRGNSSS